MKISNKDLEDLGFRNYPNKPWLWGDWEDIEYNNKTGELFYHSCIDGSIELYRKIIDINDLKQAIYDGFPYLRNQFNLD
jgi:hypothetical protein